MSTLRAARLVALVILSSSCSSAYSRPGAGAELPGMPAAGAPAVKFAPGVVSTNDVFASTFTPDGRTVVFTKFSPPKPMTLLSSSFVDGQWTTPVALPFSGTYRDLDPAFSPDGRRLYFSSARPVGTSTDTSNVDTWYAERAGQAWSSPMHLAGPVNHADVDMYPSLTNRGVLYFDSQRSVPRRRLVYRAEPTAGGGYGEPQVLDAVVNADSGASNLFVDAEERYIVFGTRRPDAVGAMDLYISWRTASGWTTPRNLGPLVNTKDVEFCPFVSRDGKYLFFTRVVTLPDQRMERNVYVVRFDSLLASLRP